VGKVSYTLTVFVSSTTGSPFAMASFDMELILVERKVGFDLDTD
jgi:hypothetical protein